MKTYIAIDPGLSGGIAYKKPGEKTNTIKMPETLRDIFDALEYLIKNNDAVVLMEKVGTYMPGNSGPSAATFAEHVGVLKAFLIALKVKHDFITPAKWMKEFVGVINYPDSLSLANWNLKGVTNKQEIAYIKKERTKINAKKKTYRKNIIKSEAQRQFPRLKITLATADALGMLSVLMKGNF